MTRFEEPFVVHVTRRCRQCRDVVTLDLVGGASAPAEGFYVCSSCASRPAATDAAIETLPPQLTLLEGGNTDA